MKKRKKRALSDKGISPVIATTLLVAMVIVIGLIIFLWFRGMQQEVITKFEKNVELSCEEVVFDASHSGTSNLYITNNGNVPIYEMEVEIVSGGDYETKTLETENSWPSKGLNPGGAVSGQLDIGSADKLVLIPVLIGSSESGQRTYVCGEKYGYEILL